MQTSNRIANERVCCSEVVWTVEAGALRADLRRGTNRELKEANSRWRRVDHEIICHQMYKETVLSTWSTGVVTTICRFTCTHWRCQQVASLMRN
ncbi:hypothetical protein NDU88_002205 [Pleurodeles waltl]|uniref:Uncharacterized protein n=1 Tax=Pleurodeles waltl TaxID=8319 RepID=A0AAV7KUP6_PLEWA|nr:hypothetical protein NDU88_002205 [Pleurodeles waltl]